MCFDFLDLLPKLGDVCQRSVSYHSPGSVARKGAPTRHFRRLQLSKDFLHVKHWSVQPCVRPVDVVHMTAGLVQSSRRLEREAGRDVEVMRLLGRLAPDTQDDRGQWP